MEKELNLTVYSDYLWPFAYRVAVWLRSLEEEYRYPAKIIWKSFSLDQINNKVGPSFKVWEDDSYPAKGWKALEAAKCASAQGNEAFRNYHYALFEARHVHRQDIADQEVLGQLAQKALPDEARFRTDLVNRTYRSTAAGEHLEAVERFGVFGTPTLIFEDKEAGYLKLKEIPENREERIQLLEVLKEVIYKRPYIQEIKRPPL